MINKIIEIGKIFTAYLVRPHLYPELARKIKKNIFQRNSAIKGRKTSEEWCKSLAVTQNEALIRITGISTHPKVNELFPGIMKSAADIEKNCPVKMGGPGALDLIYNLCEFIHAENALETGVAYGWSSLAALLSLSERNGTLYSSDMPYLGKDNDKYVGCVVPEDMRKYWKLFRFADRESLPKIFREQNKFDFIHYDSDKTYNGRMWAYPVLWEKLRLGGIFISDDIGDNSAFMDFCILHRYEPIIVEFDGKYAGIIVKK